VSRTAFLWILAVVVVLGLILTAAAVASLRRIRRRPPVYEYDLDPITARYRRTQVEEQRRRDYPTLARDAWGPPPPPPEEGDE
jgi:hypothetical protein